MGTMACKRRAEQRKEADEKAEDEPEQRTAASEKAEVKLPPAALVRCPPSPHVSVSGQHVYSHDQEAWIATTPILPTSKQDKGLNAIST